MNKLLSNQFVSLFSRIIIGLIFIIAGIEKISDPESFAVAIENYRILPIAVINIFAITLPWLELIVGLLLLLGIAVKESAFITNGLLLLFILLVITAMLRALDIECGCFGTRDGQRVGFIKIFENIGLLLLGFQLLFYYQPSFSILIPLKKNETTG